MNNVARSFVSGRGLKHCICTRIGQRGIVARSFVSGRGLKQLFRPLTHIARRRPLIRVRARIETRDRAMEIKASRSPAHS